jgi:hypothetical protein
VDPDGLFGSYQQQDGSSIPQALQQLSMLRCLHVGDALGRAEGRRSQMAGRLISEVAIVSSLRQLRLSFSISEQALSHFLCGLPHLTELEVREIIRDPREPFGAEPNFVLALVVFQCSMAPATALHRLQLAPLQSFGIHHPSRPSTAHPLVPSASLGWSETLTTLSLQGCDLTCPELDDILAAPQAGLPLATVTQKSRWPRLQRLLLDDNPRLVRCPLGLLEQFPDLTHLSISSTGVRDFESLPLLPRAHKLRILDIRWLTLPIDLLFFDRFNSIPDIRVDDVQRQRLGRGLSILDHPDRFLTVRTAWARANCLQKSSPS